MREAVLPRPLAEVEHRGDLDALLAPLVDDVDTVARLGKEIGAQALRSVSNIVTPETVLLLLRYVIHKGGGSYHRAGGATTTPVSVGQNDSNWAHVVDVLGVAARLRFARPGMRSGRAERGMRGGIRGCR